MKQAKLKKITDEYWKYIPNCDKNYQVSNYGRIKSYFIYKKQGSILKGAIIKGFRQIGLKINNAKQSTYVHKLVAEIWIPKPTEKHTYVTHLDRNLLNNHVSNLEWHTKESLREKHKEFSEQDNENLINPRGMRNTKLKVADVVLLKSMLERGVVQAAIAKMFCISEMQVTRIKRGENWAHVKAKKIEE